MIVYRRHLKLIFVINVIVRQILPYCTQRHSRELCELQIAASSHSPFPLTVSFVVHANFANGFWSVVLLPMFHALSKGTPSLHKVKDIFALSLWNVLRFDDLFLSPEGAAKGFRLACYSCSRVLNESIAAFQITVLLPQGAYLLLQSCLPRQCGVHLSTRRLNLLLQSFELRLQR